jgi:DNA-binding transcriptional LysR family regulator
LPEYPLILPGLPHSNRRLIEQVAVENGVQLNIIFEVDSVSLTKKLVSEGMGYSILAHASVQEDICNGLLIGHPGLGRGDALASSRRAPVKFLIEQIDLERTRREALAGAPSCDLPR